MLRWVMMPLMLELQALLVRVVDSRQSIEPSGSVSGTCNGMELAHLRLGGVMDHIRSDDTHALGSFRVQ
jgi:hypothetical protein